MTSTKKAPVASYSSAIQRIVLMIIVIILGIIISMSTAEAATGKIEKSPITKSLSKKNTYSCDSLKEKKRNSSNKVVKFNNRRPKWR